MANNSVTVDVAYFPVAETTLASNSKLVYAPGTIFNGWTLLGESQLWESQVHYQKKGNREIYR